MSRMQNSNRQSRFERFFYVSIHNINADITNSYLSMVNTKTNANVCRFVGFCFVFQHMNTECNAWHNTYIKSRAIQWSCEARSRNVSHVIKSQHIHFIPHGSNGVFLVDFLFVKIAFWRSKNYFAMACFDGVEYLLPVPVNEPIQIVKPDGNHGFTTENFHILIQILASDDLKDRQIVVVSVAGALRKGKSFLLNFFLKYLNARVCMKTIPTNQLLMEPYSLISMTFQCFDFQYKKKNVENWIRRKKGYHNLDGFAWRGGKVRPIIQCPNPFISL